jgi:hypothetical protein
LEAKSRTVVWGTVSLNLPSKFTKTVQDFQHFLTSFLPYKDPMAQPICLKFQDPPMTSPLDASAAPTLIAIRSQVNRKGQFLGMFFEASLI